MSALKHKEFEITDPTLVLYSTSGSSSSLGKSETQTTQVGRFTVSKVEEYNSSTVPDSLQMSKSILIPQSIFDQNQEKKPKAHRREIPAERDDRISFDEFRDHYKSYSTLGPLTLYEDDSGNVDTVQSVLMKTVEHKDSDPTKSPHLKKTNMGTFFGVFLPCCQNIVGVIYFVRFPWIVGSAGCLEAAYIVMICNMMSICTAISMSAIATNGKLTAGGTYFMISRSLGPTFGGSVGFLFFMGTSISVSMYYLGTIEILLTYIAPEISIFRRNPTDPIHYNDYRLFGTIQLCCMLAVAFIGVQCVSRFAFCAILCLVSAIFSVVIGIAVATPERSIKVCALGDRLIRYSLAFQNGTWECHKNAGGPIHSSYCHVDNGSEHCERHFLENEAKLIPGVPGFSFERLLSSLHPFYSEKGAIPATGVKANITRELVNDITTSFVILIAIYFPSITGVESGSNYSGELRDAQISIPLGTMAAAAVTSTLYLGSVIVMSASADGLLLRDKYGQSVSAAGDLVLSQMAWPSKWIVLLGTLTATIGAGLQAMAGGPRLLQAIAEDNIIPHLGFFAQKWRGEPFRGLVATYIIAEIGILIAFLDYVAPIVTMFFLMCYGFINFAVTLQSLLDLPHWRPSFKCYHWSLTLFGTALCLVTMFICNWIYALIAITMAFLLYQYIEYKGAEKEWGDGITGLSMSGALYALNRMKHDFHHTKNWRPQLLVLLKMHDMLNGESVFRKEDNDLVMLGDMLKEGKGLTMFATVIKGFLGDNVKEKERMKEVYAACLENAGIKGFIEVLVTPSVIDGLCCMVQSAGLGALRPNTIIMGWPAEWTTTRNIMALNIFLETMRNIAMAQNAAIVLKAVDLPLKHSRLQGTIDIWWIINDGGMLLLLGHLLRRNKCWSKCQLRLFTVASEKDNTVQIKEDLQTYLYQLRIEGVVEVVEMAGDDMSAYVYERTLKMEERTRMINQMQRRQSSNVSRKILDREVQHVLDNARSFTDVRNYKSMDGSSPIDHRAAPFHSLLKDREVQHVLDSARSIMDVPNYKSTDGSSPIDHLAAPQPTHDDIRHMNNAVRLNAMMRDVSSQASLVIINLPCVPESARGRANYMSFLEVLTEGLNRLLLVRGTGGEVITVYN